VERHFDVDALPRLHDATLRGDGAVGLDAKFAFSLLEGQPAIDGEMTGAVRLLCQRCLQPVVVPIDEAFQVVVVGDEAVDPEQFGSYEPIVTDASRLDLQWLAEEQALLALPLVPLHEPGECVEAGLESVQEQPAEEPLAPGKQRPFGNLRDLLKKH
jgi:uncharacterized protein